MCLAITGLHPKVPFYESCRSRASCFIGVRYGIAEGNPITCNRRKPASAVRGDENGCASANAGQQVPDTRNRFSSIGGPAPEGRQLCAGEVEPDNCAVGVN